MTRHPKDLLLLTSPAPGPQAYGFYLTEKRFPLGLGYIAAVVRDAGYTVDIVDLYAQDREVNFGNYKHIGIYANTICFEGGTLPLLKRIRKSKFKGKVIMGGPHAALLPETIPKYVYHIVQGEGENVILGILKGEYIGQRIIKADRITELDRIPMPAYDLYDLSLYSLNFEEGDNCYKVFTYSSSRGCPHRCTFCSSKNIYGRRWTGHSAQRMYEDVSYLEAMYGVDGIYFREDNFTANIKRLRRFCSLMIENCSRLLWKCETRIDIGYDDLLLMYKAGCRIVYVGFESGSQKILNRIKKDISINQSYEFVDNCKRIGLKVYGSFVSELPFEDQQDQDYTDMFIKNSHLDRHSKNKYLAMPGSELYNEIKDNPAMVDKYNTVVVS